MTPADGVEVIPLAERARWEAERADGGLPSHTWGYAWAYSACGIEPRLAVVRAGGARMLMAFFEREWRGRVDVATLQSLSGATIAPAAPEPLRAWREYAAARGWVAGYVQLEPELDAAFAPPPPDGLAVANEVFLVDVRSGDVRPGASEIVRRKVRRADRAGAEVVEDREELAAALARIHPATMERVGAGAGYRYPDEALRRWAHDPDALVVGARLGGAIEAVSVFCTAGPRAEWHVNAVSDRGRELSSWLVCAAAPRLRARGVEVLNVGGGVRPGDGLHAFKARFGGVAAPLRAVHQVYDPAAYEALRREAGAPRDAAYFPAYRA